MMQGGWGAQAVPRRTSVPSCGARGDRPLLLLFARFGVSTTEKVVICRVLPLHPMMLYHVRTVPTTLHEHPPCVPTDNSAEIALYGKLRFLVSPP